MKSDLEVSIEDEIIRAKDLLIMYEEIPTGWFGASVCKEAIRLGEESIESQDATDMVVAFKKLRSLK